MKVTQEKLPASQVALNIEISAAASQEAYDKVVQSLARTVRLPGFRKGKVPRQILLQRLGSQRVRAEALENLVQESLNDAVEQEDLNALGNFQLVTSFEELVEQYKPGEPLTFSASVDVPPEVDPGDYAGIAVQAEEVVYQPEQVDEFLDRQRSNQATLVPVEGRPAQIGDVVVVDYRGCYKDDSGEPGETITGAEATDFELELESGQFLEDLIQGIAGLEVETEAKIPVQFPEDYAREDLASVEAIFVVTLKEIKAKELPELDDEFAEDVSEFETMAELREHLEKQHRERAEQATKNNIENAIAARLAEQAAIELPKTLIDQEVDRQVRQAAVEMQRYGLDVQKLLGSSSEMLERVKAEARPEAIARLRTSLSLQEIAKREDLQLDEAVVDERIANIFQELSDRDLDPKRVREFVEDELREEVALDWLREQVSVELVPEGTLESDEEEDADEEEPTVDAASATVETTAVEQPETEPAAAADDAPAPEQPTPDKPKTSAAPETE